MNKRPTIRYLYFLKLGFINDVIDAVIDERYKEEMFLLIKFNFEEIVNGHKASEDNYKLIDSYLGIAV